MTSATRTEDDVASVFELIAAFGASSDPRLRGNAVYALAALLKRKDAEFSDLARSELLSILVGPPDGGEVWQRAFAQRALDALKALDADDRVNLHEALRESLGATSDPAQSKWIARLQLTGSEPAAECFEPGGWWHYLRLTWMAGRPSFWAGMWAGTWRTSLIWTPLIFSLMSFAVSADGTILLPLTALFMGLLTSAALAGRVTPPRRVQWIDTMVCGALFGLMAIAAAAMFPEVYGESSVLKVLPLAVAAGVLVRQLRWLAISVSTEPSGMGLPFRPLASFLSVTLLCQLCALLGVDGRNAAAAWLLLAPASAIAAWLDIWLDGHGIGAQLVQPRIRREWLLPGLSGAAAVFILMIGAYQINAAREQQRQLPPVLLSTAAPGKAGSKLVSTQFDSLLPLDVQQEGVYKITGGGRLQGSPPTIVRDGVDHVLLVLDDQRNQIASADSPEPPSIDIQLKRGRYFACVSRVRPDGCLGITPAKQANEERLATLEALIKLALSVPRKISIEIIELPGPPPSSGSDK